MASAIDFTSDSLVLVTGANGHVAQHILHQLLSRPTQDRPRVRGTYRSEHSAEVLLKSFEDHVTAGTLELARVQDITAPGAFDKAIEGCTHVAHVASPLVVSPKDTVNDLLKPAIEGTTSLLRSAARSHSVRAIVVTSSFAACFDPSKGLRPGYTYTSSDWSPLEFNEVADPNLDLTPWPSRYRKFITYLASKKLAERAAWDFYQEAGPSWQLSVINPTYIGGPCILPLSQVPEGYSYSNQLLWSIVSSQPGEKLPEADFPAWVDVRDVAKAHIQALTLPAAANHRFILAADNVTYSSIAEIARKHFKDLNPSDSLEEDSIFVIDSSEAREKLGMGEWIGIEKMVLDTVNQALDWRRGQTDE